MYVEKNILEQFKDEILRLFLKVESKLDKIIDGNNTIGDEKEYDSYELSILLKSSYRTLQRYRSDGELIYFKKRQKIFYKESDVIRFRETYFKDGVKIKQDDDSESIGNRVVSKSNRSKKKKRINRRNK